MTVSSVQRYVAAGVAALSIFLGHAAFAQNDARQLAIERDAEKALEQGKTAPAIRLYSKLIAESPKRFKLYLGRGIAYFRAKQYDKAALDFTSFAKLRPALVEGYLNRAYAYKELGKYQEALADLETVKSLDPNRGDPRLRADILAAMPPPSP